MLSFMIYCQTMEEITAVLTLREAEEQEVVQT
jgi:hypothetical protein